MEELNQACSANEHVRKYADGQAAHTLSHKGAADTTNDFENVIIICIRNCRVYRNCFIDISDAHDLLRIQID